MQSAQDAVEFFWNSGGYNLDIVAPLLAIPSTANYVLHAGVHFKSLNPTSDSNRETSSSVRGQSTIVAKLLPTYLHRISDKNMPFHCTPSWTGRDWVISWKRRSSLGLTFWHADERYRGSECKIGRRHVPQVFRIMTSQRMGPNSGLSVFIKLETK